MLPREVCTNRSARGVIVSALNGQVDWILHVKHLTNTWARLVKLYNGRKHFIVGCLEFLNRIFYEFSTLVTSHLNKNKSL